jgi:hypothetical protein
LIDPDPDAPNEKKRNASYLKLAENDQEYCDVWFSKLVHDRMILKIKYDDKYENVPCPTFKKETKDMRLEQDLYHKFITTHLVIMKGASPSPSKKYTIDFINESFKPEYDDLSRPFKPYVTLLDISTAYVKWLKRTYKMVNATDNKLVRNALHNSILKPFFTKELLPNEPYPILPRFRLLTEEDPRRENEIVVY